MSISKETVKSLLELVDERKKRFVYQSIEPDGFKQLDWIRDQLEILLAFSLPEPRRYQIKPYGCAEAEVALIEAKTQAIDTYFAYVSNRFSYFSLSDLLAILKALEVEVIA